MSIEQYERLIPRVNYFVDRRCFPDWEIIKHKINFHDLTFVIEGRSLYYVNGERYLVEAGDVIYIPEGAVREAQTVKEAPMHSYAFNFFWEEPSNHIHLPFNTVSKHMMTNEILSYIKEFTYVWMSKQPGYVMHARGLFQLIIHRLLALYFHQSSPQGDSRIDKIKEYIIDHYSEDLDMAEIAKMVQLHPVYLGKLFKQHTNYTFKEFVNRIRINNAEMMLSTGGFTVTEVAERCGFNDISYFSNVFKSIKGYPPSTVAK